MTSMLRRSISAAARVLERDERVFAVLLAVIMVGGLATLGLAPLRPRYRIDLFNLVVWFAAYKAGVFALVTVNPRVTRAVFLGALGVDLLLVFALLSAVPIPDPALEATREHVVLKGEVPSPLNPPSGCVFHPRCPIAIDDCRRVVPELREIRPGHRAACIRV